MPPSGWVTPCLPTPSPIEDRRTVARRETPPSPAWSVSIAPSPALEPERPSLPPEPPRGQDRNADTLAPETPPTPLPPTDDRGTTPPPYPRSAGQPGWQSVKRLPGRHRADGYAHGPRQADDPTRAAHSPATNALALQDAAAPTPPTDDPGEPAPPAPCFEPPPER